MKFSSSLLLLLVPVANAFVFTPSALVNQRYSTTATITSGISASSDERTPDEESFFAKTKALCTERNLNLSKVKNARDLSSVRDSPIKSGRVFRTGRLSDASTSDQDLLLGKIGVRTLVDLRSPTELKDDPTLDREEVFGEFTSLIWDERDHGVVKELRSGEPRIKAKNRKKILGHVKELVEGAKDGVDAATHNMKHDKSSEHEDGSDLVMAAADLASVTVEADDELIVEADPVLLDDDSVSNDDDGEKSKKRIVKIYQPGTIYEDKGRDGRKERHFVSIMNELKYVRGTVSKVRKRDIAKVLIKSPGAIVSKRVRSSIKEPFLKEINGGGLPMLNELLLKYGAPGIKYVLDICKDRSRHPVAFYCTAGKDRTGVIAAIMLAVAGAPEEDIIEDYSLSANVYAEMNDHKAMVGALSQRSLDAKTFLGAPPQVMRDTLATLRKNYGSVENYLDSIGFDENDRTTLKSALQDE